MRKNYQILTLDNFKRHFKASYLMWRFISTENDSIETAFRQISKEYDEGDVKTAQIHLFELTDRIISIVESKQSDCSKPVKEIELEGASDVVEKLPKEKLKISKDFYL